MGEGTGNAEPHGAFFLQGAGSAGGVGTDLTMLGLP